MTIRNLRSAVAGIQQNRRIRAIALEVINGRATVKLAGSSQLLYGLSITGGTIVAGQEVYVDYTTGNPVVHSYQEDSPSVSLATRTKVREIIRDPEIPLSVSNHTHVESQITDLLHNAVSIRGRTITTGSPSDGDTLLWDESSGSWIYGAGGEVEEAPIDGTVYGRSSGSWVNVSAGDDSSGSSLAMMDINGKIIFTTYDILTTGSSPLRIYNVSGSNRVLLGAFLALDIAPTSGSVVIDILKNNSSIFSAGEKPYIMSGFTTGSSCALSITEWNDGEYLTINIDETDGTAKDLVVHLLYKTENIVISYDSLKLVNPSLSIVEQEFFTIEGEITTGSNPLCIYNTSGSPLHIDKIFGYVNTPSNESNIIIDILKNGSSIFTSGSNQLIIPSGSNIGETSNIDVCDWEPLEPITINVLNAGMNAKNLVVQIVYSEEISDSTTYLLDAPRDGKTYGRKDGSWSEVTSGSGGGVTDHTELTNIGINTHDQIDAALLRLANTSGSNTGDQDLSLYLTDAVSDGKTYGRKDGSWAQIISSGSGGGIEEAPIDGYPYARQDANWVKIVTSGSTGSSPITMLSELTDVVISGSVITGQKLSYNSDSNIWMPNAWSAPYTQPIKTGWSWVNQGTAIINDTGFGIYVYAPPVGGYNLRIRCRTAPAPPYTITLAIIPQIHAQSYNRCGFCWRDSASGKLYLFQIGNGNDQLNTQKANSPTSWNANVKSSGIPFTPVPFWLKVQDDNTNLIMSWSADGINFIQFESIVRTSFLSNPDQVGFYVTSENATWGCGATLVSWKES